MNSKNQSDAFVKFSCIFFTVLNKWCLILLIACTCGTLFDVFKTLTYKPVYKASAIVAVMDGDGIGLDGDSTEKGNISISYLLNSQYMKKMVNNTLNQRYFDGSITITPTAYTNLCTIDVIASSQKKAYFELDALLDVYRDVSHRMSFGYYFNIVEDVHFTNTAVNLNSHKTNYIKGFVFSLILSICYFGVRSYFKDNIKTATEMDEKLDAHMIAKLPKEIKKNEKISLFKKNKSAILVSHFQTSFSYTESMGKLANKIEAYFNQNNYSTFLVTSSLENEGKSTVAVNAAISLAKNKHRVLLIDADLRKPSIHKIFEIKPEYYLSDILEENISLDKASVHLERENMDVVFSKPCYDSQKLLASENFPKLLKEAKNHYDYVIVDSSPARYISDAAMIAPECDATLVVVRQNGPSCRVVNDTIYHLSDGNVIGTIFNGSVIDLSRVHSAYGYRYGYYSYNRKGGRNHE